MYISRVIIAMLPLMYCAIIFKTTNSNRQLITIRWLQGTKTRHSYLVDY